MPSGSEVAARPPLVSRRGEWLAQGLALVLLALLGTLPFWLTDLDIRAAAIFYHPQADDPWYTGGEPLWSFLYIASPLLTGLILLIAMLVLGAGRFWSWSRRLRCYAILLILLTIIGPGLVVNGLFKDNWGRPRPHQVEQLGGTRPYVPPLALGERGKGKSFPCGHSSVGYMLGVFFMIWLRRRPLLAWTALAGALVLGTLLGIGRMAAGDHFLSDVIWSAVIVHAIALGLYYFVLRIPQREALAASQPASPPAPLAYPRLTAAGYGGLAALLVAGVLLATPLKTVQFLLVRPHEQDAPPRTLRLVADEANVILFWTSGADRRAQVRLEARGFGLPWSRVESELTQDREHLTYRLTHRGIFTEKDTKLVVGIVAAEWDRIEVRLDSGDIQIQSAAPPLPALDPMTADGRVVWATH